MRYWFLGLLLFLFLSLSTGPIREGSGSRPPGGGWVFLTPPGVPPWEGGVPPLPPRQGGGRTYVTFWPVRATRAILNARLGRKKEPLRSEEHTSELQSQSKLVCRLRLEKKR